MKTLTAGGGLGRWGWLVFLAGVVGAAGSELGGSLESLGAGFRSPPPEARPWVYWFWMDGNVSREGITADLEAMNRVGIGGMVLMEVDVGIPRGPVRFMSPEWRGLFVHAVREAERLGLEMTLNAGPGWTGSGGPWVRPEQSMQHLVASQVQVAGPGEVEIAVPRPAPRDPHFVHAPLPPGVKEARDGFFQDVALVAFPTPAAGPGIPEVDEKALYYRLPYSSHPGVRAGIPSMADSPELPAAEVIEPKQVVDLTGRLQADGLLRWAVPPGAWTVMRLGRASTGANTRPAPAPGIGLECDKFDPAALDAHFAGYLEPLLRGLGREAGVAIGDGARRRGWTMVHIDSWEMGAQNWSGRFPEEFRNRRGYDLLPYLPAMTGRPVGTLGQSERFLWDIRQTAQELVMENHAVHLKALARRHGMGLSIEPYDMNPCADLSLGGVADVPMGEFWSDGYGFDTAFSVIEAVSVAHTRGRPVVAAEAFTSTDAEAWRLHPGRMKAQADWSFAAGINRLVIHRFAHQPWPGRRPGMTMGPYGVHHDRTQTWWEMSGAWHAYLARCQYLLRQGSPVADVCYLVPEGAPQVFRAPPSALGGRTPVPDRRGYSFDGCAPETLLTEARVESGSVVFPGGASYRLLVLPERETMTPRLLARVKALVEAGATVLGRPPRRSPSLAGFPDCDDVVAWLARELWGPGDAAPVPGKSRQLGLGRVITSTGVADASEYVGYGETAGVLESLGLPVDFESDEALRCSHRRHSGGDLDVYFVANREGRPVRAVGWFRVAGRVAEVWDPRTGGIRSADGLHEEGGRSGLPLSLEPYGSRFIVFRPRKPGEEAPVAGPVDPPRLPASPTPWAVGAWEAGFPEEPGGAGTVRFPALVSWAEHEHPGIRHFSGTATYRTDLELPPEVASRDGRRWWLDLGRVEVMARVRLNGTDLGVVWVAPYRVDLTPAARPGQNRLELEVANLWPNRLIGDAGKPVGDRNSWTTWNPYKPETPLLPSGLLGPVTVLALDPAMDPYAAPVSQESWGR